MRDRYECPGGDVAHCEGYVEHTSDSPVLLEGGRIGAEKDVGAPAGEIDGVNIVVVDPFAGDAPV